MTPPKFKASLSWEPTNATGTRWILVLTLEFRRELAVVYRSPSGSWEVPVRGGLLTFDRGNLDRAVERAEQLGLADYGLRAPIGRMERRSLIASVREISRAREVPA